MTHLGIVGLIGFLFPCLFQVVLQFFDGLVQHAIIVEALRLQGILDGTFRYRTRSGDEP